MFNCFQIDLVNSYIGRDVKNIKFTARNQKKYEKLFYTFIVLKIMHSINNTMLTNMRMTREKREKSCA